MAIRLKSGAGWVGPVGDGNLRIKWGGPWISPSYVYCKIGDLGGGYWQDSGYRGYPNPPSTPWVNTWGYGNCQVAWNYPAGGGAAIAYYHVVMTDVNGSWIAEENSTDNVSPNWGVNQDSRYRFYVRSVAQNGLASPFQGPLNVGIGHPSTPNYGYVQRTQYWSSEHLSGARNKDDPFWVGVPSSVLLQGMHWRNLRTGGMSGVVAPGTNRQVAWIVYSNEYGHITDNYGTIYNGSSIDHPLNNWADGSAWGIVARGAGWSTTGNGYYMLWLDDFWCDGTYYYDNYEIVSWNPEQGNYYW